MKRAVKKILFSLLCIMLMIPSVITPASAYTLVSGTVGDNIKWRLDSSGELVFSGTGDMKDFPNNAYASYAAYNSRIKNVVFEEGITSVGNYALAYYTNVTSVTLPDSITEIGDCAFCGTSITKVDLSNKVKSIGNRAFANCSKLTSLKIPYGVTTIGDSAFSSSDNLTLQVYENSVAYTYAVNNNIKHEVLEYIPITKVVVKEPMIYIKKGESYQLEAYVLPENTTEDKTITWTLANSGFVSVDENGVVTGLKQGQGVVIAMSSNRLYEYCGINVIEIPISSIKLDHSEITLNENETLTLKPTIAPSDATDDKTVTWTSSDENVASVSNSGVVTAKCKGTATITATTSNGKTTTCTVTVLRPIATITLNHESVSLEVDETETLVATISPEGTTDSTKITWKSSNPSVASVDDNGIIRSHLPGSAIITATTSNGLNASCTVHVHATLRGVKLSHSFLELQVDDALTLEYQFIPAVASAGLIEWKSSDSSVVSVSNNGDIKVHKAGTAIITLTAYETDEVYYTASCYIYVTDDSTIKGPSLQLLKDYIKTKGVEKNNYSYITYTHENISVEIRYNKDMDTLVFIGNDGDYSFEMEVQGNKVKTFTKINVSKGEKSGYTYIIADQYKDELLGVYNFNDEQNDISTRINKWFTICSTFLKETLKFNMHDIGFTGFEAASGYGLCNATCIEFSSSTYKMSVDDSRTLSLVFNPTDATGQKDITWSSSNKDVVTVNESGNVVAVGGGTAIITASTNNGLSAQCKITVIDRTPIKNYNFIALKDYIRRYGSGSNANSRYVSTSLRDVNFNYEVSIIYYLNDDEIDFRVKKISTDELEFEFLDMIVKGEGPGHHVKVSIDNYDVHNMLNPATYVGIADLTTREFEESGYGVSDFSFSKYSNISYSTANSLSRSSLREAFVFWNKLLGQTSLRLTMADIGFIHWGNTSSNSIVEARGISLNKNQLNLTKGATFTLSASITPSYAYDKSVTWKSSNESVVTVVNGKVTAVGEGTATITAMTYNGYKAKCVVTVEKGESFPFTDVKKSKWYYSIVKEAYEAGLMSGTSETTFSPDDNMTRGMLVTVLHRIAGKPSVPYTGRFKDVSSKTYCATAVEWAAKYKVVNGNSDGTFKPNDNITRQDVAVILYNYARALGLDVTNNTDLSKFADYKSVSNYAKPAMQWAVSVGILGGATDKNTGDIYLNPKNNATRAECAKMLLVASKIYK